MYSKFFAGILVFALILAPMAMAGPLSIVKKAARDVGDVVTGSSSAAAGNTGVASGDSGARPGVKKHDKYPPGVSFSTMLNGVTYRPDEGKLRLDNIQATFLADDAAGYIILRKEDGKEVLKWDWKVDTFQTKKPYCLLNIMSVVDLRTGETISGSWVDVKEPGNYVLDFYLPDEHFYSFSFSISKMSGDDPFSSEDRWFTDGDWEKCAYFLYFNADPGQSLVWKVWLRNKATGRDRDVKPKIEV
ncbi:MAG: hypothetical protein KAH38_00420, partial [Candidatus Hydrogenedentes bacterium]|nr:hypothetical protein [Candidatus Hydrogenedentota bacterium]